MNHVHANNILFVWLGWLYVLLRHDPKSSGYARNLPMGIGLYLHLWSIQDNVILPVKTRIGGICFLPDDDKRKIIHYSLENKTAIVLFA